MQGFLSDPFGFATEFDGFFQVLLGFIQFAQLAGVAGEVVGDEPLFGEELGGGQQVGVGLLGAFEFMQGKAAFDPGVRKVGAFFPKTFGQGQYFGPPFLAFQDFATDHQHHRMFLGGGGNLVEFGEGGIKIAQAIPTFGGFGVHAIGLTQWFHLV